MSGFINTAGDAAASSGPDSIRLSNPLLQEAEEKIEANIGDPATREKYNDIVDTGMSIALQNGIDSFLAKLRHNQDPISGCATGAVALVLVMRQESKGVMPIKAMVPAGMTLLFHGLNFIERAKMAKIAEPEIDRATTIFVNTLLHKLGITGKMLQNAAINVHKITQNPEQMELINRKAGLVASPGASQPPMMP